MKQLDRRNYGVKGGEEVGLVNMGCSVEEFVGEGKEMRGQLRIPLEDLRGDLSVLRGLAEGGKPMEGERLTM